MISLPLSLAEMVGLLAAGVLAWLGHLALGVVIINRVHGLGIPHAIQRRWDVVWCLWQIMTPVAVFAYYYVTGATVLGVSGGSIPLLIGAYVLVGQIVLLFVVIGWVQREWLTRPAACLLRDQFRSIPVPGGKTLACDGATRILARIPGNQVFQLQIHEKSIYLPQLPTAWEGLRLAHLSDLHLTGQIAEAFFQEIVTQTQTGRPDLIAITGDIIDKDRCLPWLTKTLGQLQADLGVWFVLGNHDQRVSHVGALRQRLRTAGMQDLGGRTAILRRNNEPLVLVGNELPWFAPAGDLAMVRRDPQLAQALTLGLAHTPDQIDWARQNRIDLLLAGHTHGGQVRFPILGPILSPSRYGVRYASGTFLVPPTAMHVSRGLSGTRPLRIRCAPELTFLTLTSQRLPGVSPK